MKRTIRSLLAGALLCGTGLSVQAQSLFEDMVLADQDVLLETPILGSTRSRQVIVDPVISADIFRETETSKSLKVSLFPGLHIDLQRTDLDKNFGEGTRSWSGRVAGFEDGYATFVSDKAGRLMGHVQYGGQIFRIIPRGDGIHTIYEIALGVHKENEQPLVFEAPAGKKAENGFSTQAWPTAIDVLVMYTPGAVTEAVNDGVTPKDEALLALSMAKTAMVNTGLKTHRFRWRGYRGFGPCNYSAKSDAGEVLFNVTSAVGNSAPCMSGHANAKRDQVGADLVAVVKSSGGCGAAWYSLGGGIAEFGFSVTARDCIAEHRFTQGLGSNLGLNNDRVAVNAVGTDQNGFNYGMTYPNRSTPVRTVMALDNNCTAMSVTCTPVPVFSNSSPNGTWNNQRMGRGLHLSDPALNRKTIMNNWNIIANYR